MAVPPDSRRRSAPGSLRSGGHRRCRATDALVSELSRSSNRRGARVGVRDDHQHPPPGAVHHCAERPSDRRAADHQLQPARAGDDDPGRDLRQRRPDGGTGQAGCATPCGRGLGSGPPVRRRTRPPRHDAAGSTMPPSPTTRGSRRAAGHRAETAGGRSRGASRQMRLPVPTATVESTIRSLPCAASAPAPATRHSPPAVSNSRAVAALPSDACASRTRRTRMPRSAARTSAHRYEGPTSYIAASMLLRAPVKSRISTVPAASGPSAHVSTLTVRPPRRHEPAAPPDARCRTHPRDARCNAPPRGPR